MCLINTVLVQNSMEDFYWIAVANLQQNAQLLLDDFATNVVEFSQNKINLQALSHCFFHCYILTANLDIFCNFVLLCLREKVSANPTSSIA